MDKSLSGGAKFTVNNGENTLFWEDVWLGEVPLKLSFSHLYEYCREKKCLVSECWKDGEWTVDFKRSLSLTEADQWGELVNRLDQVQINGNRDKVSWVLEKLGKYTSSSMYRFMSHRGVVNSRMR